MNIFRRKEKLAEAEKQFIEENRAAVFEEMAKSINIMNELMQQIIQTPDNEEGEIAAKKIQFQLFHSLGALTILFNQYYILMLGQVPQEEERKIGFDALAGIKET